MSNNNKLEANHREYQCEFPRKFIRDFSRKYSRLFASIIIASIFLLSIFYFLFSSSAEAAGPLKLQVQFPCPDFPGAPCPATPEKAAESPAAYIARFYQFALAIAGMLAFGMIIFGAIQYTVSAGNVTKQGDARDRIYQALWGVALLLGAYLILYTIDPKLVSLKDPDIEIVKIETPWTPEKSSVEEIESRRTLAENMPCVPGKPPFCASGLKCDIPFPAISYRCVKGGSASSVFLKERERCDPNNPPFCGPGLKCTIPFGKFVDVCVKK